MVQRITRGDAEAVLNAFGSGGWAVRQHSKVVKGSPADDIGSHGAIRPFKPWNKIHLCAQDWHVILVADIEGGDASFTREDAEAIMSKIEIRFELDGAPLETRRTAISRMLNPERFEYEEAYCFQQGRVMAPEELAPGSHLLLVTMSGAAGDTFSDSITFFIDPPGQGSCV